MARSFNGCVAMVIGFNRSAVSNEKLSSERRWNGNGGSKRQCQFATSRSQAIAFDNLSFLKNMYFASRSHNHFLIHHLVIFWIVD
jgi:hypothetical protein